jgi:hypothetical protein
MARVGRNSVAYSASSFVRAAQYATLLRPMISARLGYPLASSARIASGDISAPSLRKISSTGTRATNDRFAVHDVRVDFDAYVGHGNLVMRLLR